MLSLSKIPQYNLFQSYILYLYIFLFNYFFIYYLYLFIPIFISISIPIFISTFIHFLSTFPLFQQKAQSSFQKGNNIFLYLKDRQFPKTRVSLKTVPRPQSVSNQLGFQTTLLWSVFKYKKILLPFWKRTHTQKNTLPKNKISPKNNTSSKKFT